jgi:hypothetical protein
MPDPIFFKSYVGSTLGTAHGSTILRIGQTRFSRYDITHKLDCSATPKAAKILQAALDALGVKTTRDALAVNPIDLADIPFVGVTTLYLFLCWQRYVRDADDAKVATWYGQDVTFGTLKVRARKRKEREKPRKNGRPRARQEQREPAHAIH